MLNLTGFGSRLKSSITNSKYTQKDLSEYFRISQDTLTNYVKEKSFPKIDFLIELCNFLDISIEWLLTGNENAEVQISESEAKLLKLYKLIDKSSEYIETISSLTNDEIKFLSLYRQLSDTDRIKIEGAVEMKIAEAESSATQEDLA